MSSEKALVRCEKRTSVTLVTCHPECSYHAHRCSAPLGTAFRPCCARACARVRSAVGVAIFPLPDTLSLSVIVQTEHVNIIGLTLGRSHQSVGWARQPFVTSDKNNGLQAQGTGQRLQLVQDSLEHRKRTRWREGAKSSSCALGPSRQFCVIRYNWLVCRHVPSFSSSGQM